MKKSNSKGKKKIKRKDSTAAKKNPAKNSNGNGSKKISVKKNREKKLKHQGKDKPMPVVGIGASAGGLEAFSKFLESIPPNLGMAYVYVQHLSPTHESLLPEILERKTSMPVLQGRKRKSCNKHYLQWKEEARHQMRAGRRLVQSCFLRLACGNRESETKSWG